MLAFNPALGVPVMYRQMEAKIDKEDARLDLAMEKIAELERALELRDPQGLDQERSLVPVGGTIVRSAMATRFGRADGARRYAKLTDADGAPLYAEEMECPEGWATDTTRSFYNRPWVVARRFIVHPPPAGTHVHQKSPYEYGVYMERRPTA